MIIYKKVSGSSLSEVLIALFLSSLMMAAIGNTYVSIKKHYLFIEQQLELMQEEVLLINFFKEQIQSAGFFGCNHQNKLLLDLSSFNISKSSLLVLNKNSKELPLHVRRYAVSDSQILKLTSIETPKYFITKSDFNSEVITVNKSENFKKNQNIVISDCQNASLRIITKVNNLQNRLILNKPLNYQYSRNSIISHFQTTIFYIRKVGNSRALYISNGKRSEELSRDILKLSIDKKILLNTSLININLNRLNNVALNFYVTMIGL